MKEHIAVRYYPARKRLIIKRVGGLLTDPNEMEYYVIDVKKVIIRRGDGGKYIVQFGSNELQVDEFQEMW